MAYDLIYVQIHDLYNANISLIKLLLFFGKTNSGNVRCAQRYYIIFVFLIFFIMHFLHFSPINKCFDWLRHELSRRQMFDLCQYVFVLLINGFFLFSSIQEVNVHELNRIDAHIGIMDGSKINLLLINIRAAQHPY